MAKVSKKRYSKSTDITMCKGDDCPFKTMCHRYTAEPDEYQSYFLIPPFTIENGKPDCKMFWGETADHLFVMLTEIMGNKNKPTSSSKPKSR